MCGLFFSFSSFFSFLPVFLSTYIRTCMYVEHAYMDTSLRRRSMVYHRLGRTPDNRYDTLLENHKQNHTRSTMYGPLAADCSHSPTPSPLSQAHMSANHTGSILGGHLAAWCNPTPSFPVNNFPALHVIPDDKPVPVNFPMRVQRPGCRRCLAMPRSDSSLYRVLLRSPHASR